MTITIKVGDSIEQLRGLADNSVHCCVTSPPYWGLRDYDVEGQIGLEPTFDAYVAKMIEVFREVRRVLRDDGTLWLNLGDSYNAYNGGAGPSSALSKTASAQRPQLATGYGLRDKTLKPKDMVGIPWRVAFALQADGWWLRQWLPWVKRNPMPESAKDRPTTACETIFMLTKSERYFYDFEAVKRAASPNTNARISQKAPDGWATHEGGHGSFHRDGREKGITRPKRVKPDGMNRANESFENATCHEVLSERMFRNADLFYDSIKGPHGLITDADGWPIAIDVVSEPFKQAHFATFPSRLVGPLIRASCPEGGTTLDPFGGAGTVGMVANRMGRNAILVELNPAYVEIAKRRIEKDGGLFSAVNIDETLSSVP